MRRIQDLLGEDRKVWFYLKDEETKHRFVEELNRLGATYLNGAVITLENCSQIMAVHSDLKVAHLMIMIWNASFSYSFPIHHIGDTGKILKVDYAKYVTNDPEYDCLQSGFIPKV